MTTIRSAHRAVPAAAPVASAAAQARRWVADVAMAQVDAASKAGDRRLTEREEANVRKTFNALAPAVRAKVAEALYDMRTVWPEGWSVNRANNVTKTENICHIEWVTAKGRAIDALPERSLTVRNACKPAEARYALSAAGLTYGFKTEKARDAEARRIECHLGYGVCTYKKDPQGKFVGHGRWDRTGFAP